MRNTPAGPRPLAMRSGKASATSLPQSAVSGGAELSPPTFRAKVRASRRASSARAERSRRKPSRRWAMSGPSPPRPRSTRRVATSAAAKAAPSAAAATIILARRGGRARRAMASPSAVSAPSVSIAPIPCSSARASFSAGAGGGSSHLRVSGSRTPHAARSRTSPERSAAMISGGAKASSAPDAASSQRR